MKAVIAYKALQKEQIRNLPPPPWGDSGQDLTTTEMHGGGRTSNTGSSRTKDQQPFHDRDGRRFRGNRRPLPSGIQPEAIAAVPVRLRRQ
jgi:hypothetical protein